MPVANFYLLDSVCSELCNLDNRHTKKGTEIVLSSELIVNRFGGQEGIMKALYTDPVVSTHKKQHYGVTHLLRPDYRGCSTRVNNLA